MSNIPSRREWRGGDKKHTRHTRCTHIIAPNSHSSEMMSPFRSCVCATRHTRPHNNWESPPSPQECDVVVVGRRCLWPSWRQGCVAPRPSSALLVLAHSPPTPPLLAEAPAALPAPVEEGPDETGVKTITTYRRTDKGVEKVVRRVKVITTYTRVPRGVRERKEKMARFGAAKSGNEGTTYPSTEEVRIELLGAAPEKSGLEAIVQQGGVSARQASVRGGVCALTSLSLPPHTLSLLPRAGAVGARTGRCRALTRT